MFALCPQQQGVGAFGEIMTMEMGQIIETVEQPQHQVGIKGVVAGRARQHQLGQWAVPLQPKRALC